MKSGDEQEGHRRQATRPGQARRTGELAQDGAPRLGHDHEDRRQAVQADHLDELVDVRLRMAQRGG